MRPKDEFASLDLYSLLFTSVGGLTLAYAIAQLIFMIAAAGFLAALAVLPLFLYATLLLAAGRLLACTLRLHRDTRTLLERAGAAPGPAPGPTPAPPSD